MTITDTNDFCYCPGRRSPAEVLDHGGHRFRHRGGFAMTIRGTAISAALKRYC
jgi:hypothetical protein